jgi:peptidase M23-like protein/type IX secretion system substrate protein
MIVLRKRIPFSLSAFSFFFIFSVSSFAQSNDAQPAEEGGGQYPLHINDAAHPCIKPEQYTAMERRIAGNMKLLGIDTRQQRKTTATSFSWPMQAAGLSDCSYYFIANYVDQDATAGIKDYNCGTVTYDGHRGTDIATHPYPFYKMDHDQVNDIAAAPGTIIDKSDGYFDRNCAMSSDTANYIIIQHADGSCALYWHMKKFSLTTKTVGMTVATGEFLGVAGSSGSSTDPHLHFEVWGTTLSSSLKDPFTGTCNLLNPTSWWASQKPYTEPAIVKAQVNMLPVVLPGCDTTEIPNDDTCFAPGATAKFYIFIRNETPGLVANESILNPDGSPYSTWVHNSTTSYLASYWYFNRVLPTTPGIYTFKTQYNGLTCSKTFAIDCGVLGLKTTFAEERAEVYPNPATNTFNIVVDNIENGNYSLRLKNIIGQVVYDNNVVVGSNLMRVACALLSLSNGIYFLSVESDSKKITRKIIIQN